MPRRRAVGATIPALLLLGALATGARAQTTLDEGTFRLTLGGRQVGTETFSIRQSGSGAGAVVVASGRVVVDADGAQELTASLELAGLTPRGYQISVTGNEPQRIAGRVGGGRFSARITSASGEMMREYLVSDGAVLLDEGVAHHYFILAQRVTSGSARVPILIPRQSRQVVATITDAGSAPVEIGGRSIAARQLVVAPAGLPERRVSVDDQGRVLRLEIPARDYVAVRTAAPR